jgi:hypothetical protein
MKLEFTLNPHKMPPIYHIGLEEQLAVTVVLEGREMDIMPILKLLQEYEKEKSK